VAAQRLVRGAGDDMGMRHWRGYRPDATSPAKCAMSTRNFAPISSAMERKAAKSMMRA
jgi:hypothetical protein